MMFNFCCFEKIINKKLDIKSRGSGQCNPYCSNNSSLNPVEVYKRTNIMRVDMAQLVERSLPKPGVRSSTSHRQNFIINMFTANC